MSRRKDTDDHELREDGDSDNVPDLAQKESGGEGEETRVPLLGEAAKKPPPPAQEVSVRERQAQSANRSRPRSAQSTSSSASAGFRHHT